MPIDPAVAIGAALPDRTFSWSASDVLLYHLAIGAGARAGDNLDPAVLRYTYDGDDLQVLPSFGVVAPGFHETEPPVVSFPGCEIDLAPWCTGRRRSGCTCRSRPPAPRHSRPGSPTSGTRARPR